MMYYSIVRTTFTPEPDIEDRLRELSRTSRRSLSAVVNDLLRIALNGERHGLPERPRFRIEAHSFRARPGFDLAKPSEILAEIEAAEH
jgi:hypothetical protein